MDKTDLQFRHLFICGFPKSGTSLLRNLLDGHPELIVYPEESHFFRKFIPMVYKNDIKSNLKLSEKSLIKIFEWNTETPPEHQKGFEDRDYSRISFDEIKQELNKYIIGLDNVEYKDFLTGAIVSYGLAEGLLGVNTKWLVEKTPYNELFIDEIFNYWPESKCIHIVRDPRDNFASYKKKQKEWTVKQFCESWNKTNSKYLKSIKRYSNDNLLLIKYEDLIYQFEEKIEEIISFLNINYHESLLTPTRANVKWKGNSMFNQKFDSISSIPVGRFENELVDHEIELIEMLCRKNMKKFGYSKSRRVRFSVLIKGIYYSFYHFMYILKEKLFLRKLT